MSAQVTYIPEENERAYYQGLFKAADVQGQGQIGGAEAVKFFTLSKLPIDTLKSIWTVADQPPSNSLDPPKFAVAVRLIQCMQNGKRGQGANLATPAGVTMRPAMFDGVSGVSVPFPEDGAPPAPDAPPSQPQAAPGGPPADSHMSMMAQQHQQASTAVPPQDTYGMTQQAVQRVEPVFKEYAKEDGFVYGAEAVALFGKSGMLQAQLAAIWKMVDTPVDNRLDKLEFAMAMHLIVCVMKKNMPMPSGLPASLQQLKQQSQPQAAAAAPPSHTPAPAAESQESAAASAPALGAAQGGMSISDAFDGLDPEPALTPEQEAPAPLPEPETTLTPPQVQVAPAVTITPAQPAAVESVGAMAVPPHPAAVVTQQATQPVQGAQDAMASATPQAGAAISGSDAGASPPSAVSAVGATGTNGDSAELNQMKELLTRLQAENISLKAQLSGSAEEERAVQQELATTIAEVARLSSVLEGLRQDVSTQKTRLMDQTTALKSTIGSAGGSASGANTLQPTLYGAGMPASYQQNPASATTPSYGQPAAASRYVGATTPGYGEAPPPASVETVESKASAGSPPQPEPSLEIQAAQGASQLPQVLSGSQQSGTGASVNSAGGDQPGQIPSPQDMPQTQSGSPGPGRGLPVAPSVFGFSEGDAMGQNTPLPKETEPVASYSAPQEAQQAASYSASAAPTSSPEQLQEMQKKSQDAQERAQEAEDSHRTIMAEVEKLRKAAEDAEAAHTSQRRTSELSQSQKKKGMFGGGNKQQKKQAKLAEQMALDAKAKKDELLQAQGRANEAQALAMETRREADKLRKAAEEAEMAQASANSMQQPSSGAAPQPPPPQQQQAQQLQQQAPLQQTPPFQQQTVDPSGGFSIPTPPSAQTYANPFG